MTYVAGFLLPVPTANREAFAKHARSLQPFFRKHGVTRVVEAWGDDVPDGKINDLKKAVNLEDGETVVISWFEFPDKAARDAANAGMMTDTEMAATAGAPPFDGKRMIMGGFETILEEGSSAQTANGAGYVDGFVVPVPADKKEAYRAMAANAAPIFREYGALRIVENWGDDTQDGKLTDFHRATLKQPEEKVVYSWIEWPDKATRDTAWAKIMQDERMKPPAEMPMDGKRMMWGGFTRLIDETL